MQSPAMNPGREIQRIASRLAGDTPGTYATIELTLYDLWCQLTDLDSEDREETDHV